MAAPCANHGSDEENVKMNIYKELDVQIYTQGDSVRPEKTACFLNPKMKINRELILLALAAKVKGQTDDITSCLDAFSASGVQALQWKKYLKRKVRVTANDLKSEAVSGITANCHLNGFSVQDNPETDQSEAVIETSCQNANLLLHQRAFQFIHLDPFGSAVSFLDAAFSNLPKDGVLSVTSTDVSAFLGKCPQVTMRHYSGHVIKCEYQPELSCRLIIASLARAAARCHKGVEVLFAFAREHFILTAVRVLRGYKKADESLKEIRRLLHCNFCEERVFLKETLLVEDNLYENLSCSCYKTHPGKTASLLGPVWSGRIFSDSFIEEMILSSNDIPGLSSEVEAILEKMQTESKVGSVSSNSSEKVEKLSTFGKRKSDFEQGCDPKAKKVDIENSGCEGDSISSEKSNLGQNVEENRTEERLHMDPAGIKNVQQKATENTSQLAMKDLQREGASPAAADSKKSSPHDSIDNAPARGKCKSINVVSKHGHCYQDTHVPFYFTVVKHCPNKGKWPRMKSVLESLRAKNHQASLTVFHNRGIRTTASLKEYIQALEEWNLQENIGN